MDGHLEHSDGICHLQNAKDWILLCDMHSREFTMWQAKFSSDNPVNQKLGSNS